MTAAEKKAAALAKLKAKQTEPKKTDVAIAPQRQFVTPRQIPKSANEMAEEFRQKFDRLRADVDDKIQAFIQSLNTRLSADGLQIADHEEWQEVPFDGAGIKTLNKLAADGWRFAFIMQKKEGDKLVPTKVLLYRSVYKTKKINNGGENGKA